MGCGSDRPGRRRARDRCGSHIARWVACGPGILRARARGGGGWAAVGQAHGQPVLMHAVRAGRAPSPEDARRSRPPRIIGAGLGAVTHACRGIDRAGGLWDTGRLVSAGRDHARRVVCSKLQPRQALLIGSVVWEVSRAKNL